jgi:hypothetical protein
VKSYTRTYTAKDTAKELFKANIKEHISGLTDAKSGSADWIRHYPSAHAAVFNDLDEDQLEECEQLAKEWNEVGPHPDKQARQASQMGDTIDTVTCLLYRNANRYLTSTVNKFMNDMARAMGVQMFILVGHKSNDDKILQYK